MADYVRVMQPTKLFPTEIFPPKVLGFNVSGYLWVHTRRIISSIRPWGGVCVCVNFCADIAGCRDKKCRDSERSR